MPTFQYEARTVTGETVSGIMQADTEGAVARALDEKRLYPVRVREHRSAAGRQGRRIRLRDVGVMYGQLADLLRAGVPLLRALDTISRAGINQQLAKVLKKVAEGVSAGKTLADAMADSSGVFPSLHVAMVRAGEKAGFLEDVLENLATFIERVDEMQSKIRGAMIYPIILTCLGAAVTVGMLVWFVPKLRTMLAGTTPPAATRILFAMSDALRQHYLLLLAGLAAVVVSAWTFIHSDSGRRTWERWRLKIPGVGKVIRTISITRFCRILGTMLANGVPILQALHISKDATGSVILADNIEQAAESVRAGETLTAPLRASGLFPPQILEMIAVAEESNQLDRVLVQIADTVERRTDRAVDQAVRMVEPLILVVMASAIATLAVGLLSAIMSMTQALE
ncbi:MAG: type II secretion system F family protein [Planctomycetes bacterium]|nr:type II secretion system F family protein [Planctomycetota bacterium]